MVKCVVSGCPNRMATVKDNRGLFNRPSKRFFKFPKDPARVKVWLAALRETDKHDLTEQHLICEDHFLPDDISTNEIRSDAIPIMPPCLDGGLGMMGSWGAELSEEDDDQWATGGDEEDDDGPANIEPAAPKHPVTESSAPDPPTPEPPAPEPPLPEPPLVAPACQVPDTNKTSVGKTIGIRLHQSTKRPVCRSDASSVEMTQRFLEMMLASPDNLVDTKSLTGGTQTGRRRIYEITSVLEGIDLIEKQSVHKFKWIGKPHVSSFLWRTDEAFQAEMEQLKLVESALDSLIKSCAQQLFDVTDDLENAALAYVTHADISRLTDFQQQTVIVVKAPEETKLEVPAPKEDNIQVHLKAGRGPIVVLTCDIGSGDATGETSSCFLPPEESRIKTMTLHTDGPQSSAECVASS